MQPIFLSMLDHTRVLLPDIAQNTAAGFQVYSVDLWHAGNAHDNTFQQFLSNVVQENTANTIVPLRMVLIVCEGNKLIGRRYFSGLERFQSAARDHCMVLASLGNWFYFWFELVEQRCAGCSHSSSSAARPLSSCQ